MTGVRAAGGARATVRGQQRFGPSAQRSALAPVREAMLRQARERATEIVGEARRNAAATVAHAQADAAQLVAQGREAGRAQAAPLADAQLARGRRDARSHLLRAQREAHDELRARVRAGVSALRSEPGYPQLLERLRHVAGRAAGPGAVVTEDPAGGAVARARGVVVDCSLPALADAAVAGLGPGVAWLWTAGRGVGKPGGRAGAPSRRAVMPGGTP